MALINLVVGFFQAVSIHLMLPLFSFFSRLHKNGRELIGEPQKDDVSEFRDSDNDCNKSEVVPDFSLNFKFPTLEEFSRIKTGSGNNLADLVASGNKYVEFASGKCPVVAFIEEPDNHFPVREINLDNIGEVNEAEMSRNKTLSGKEFPGNHQGFLDESIFCSSEKNANSDSFLYDLNFMGNPVVERKKSGSGENQELPECCPDRLTSGFLSEEDFNDKKTVPKDSSDDTNKLETLWEHQELIEQLKMELRKVRATGLPTIFEESETSPRITEDLKPWKIDESLQYEDCMDEVNKLCKSYRETMRKFDIFNYQKMYAMGFLQFKDPFQQTLLQQRSPPTLKSFISQNLWLFKHKRCASDPMKKFVDELQGDLEVVYVGQLCLSWEFLHWQYEKALDLWNSDPHEIHHYNEVAGEFQQFQVLMQRFMEDERFQGSRVQSYVKSRCVLRNLLQVPAIREDDGKDKQNKTKRKDINRDNEYLITSETLVEIVEESIRILWRFVRSDKDCNSLPNNGHKKMPQIHNPQDLKLLLQVKKTLLKKERKLRDIVRSEKCILRRFHLQTREDSDSDSDQILFFFAQVDMKLVCRVLNMSKITRDQLIWCQNKLSRISFVNRKINVHPAFLLFPC